MVISFERAKAGLNQQNGKNLLLQSLFSAEISLRFFNLMNKPLPPSSSKTSFQMSLVVEFIARYRYELIGGTLLLLLGVLPRIIFVVLFPTRPLSDFANILNLAQSFQEDILGRGNIYWKNFSPGLPLIFGFLFHQTFLSAEETARIATATVSGFSSLVPFLLWKDVLSRKVRILAGILLALWPVQIVFTGVLAQDNWILLPSVGLAALAVRTLAGNKFGYPIMAGLCYALTVAIRQEMLIALLPISLIAILGRKKERWIHNALMGSMVIASVFACLMIQRGLATGRYTLTTKHFGVSLLGSYIPGAGLGWVSPVPYLNSVHPGMIRDVNFEEEALQLVKDEFLRRPGFHSIRILGLTLYNLFQVERGLVPWSLSGEGSLPEGHEKRGKTFAMAILPLLTVYPIILHGIFLTAVFFVSLKRNPLLFWISPLLLSIILKLGLHAVIVTVPRYFLVVEAFEILVVAIVLEPLLQKENGKTSFYALLLGVITTAVMLMMIAQTQRYLRTYDIVPQIKYRFSMRSGGAVADCSISEGRLIYSEDDQASIQLLNLEPQDRESAIALCELQVAEAQPVQLSVFDAYPEGNLSERIRLIISVNDVDLLHHDIADDPWTGWIDIPLGVITPDASVFFRIEVRAIHPDQGWYWGESSLTEFRIAAGD